MNALCHAAALGFWAFLRLLITLGYVFGTHSQESILFRGKTNCTEGIAMKLKTCVAVLAGAICLPLLSSEGRAQTAPLAGTVVSSFSGVSGGSTTGIFFTTPAVSTGRRFILTQFCASGTNVVLVGGPPVGQIAVLPTTGCVSFTPGFAIPPNTPISCTLNSGTGLQCSISGVSESAIQAGGGGLGGLGSLR